MNREQLLQLLQPWLPQVRKAANGGLSVIILSALALVGVDEGMTVGDAVQVIVTGLVTYVVVWFTSNRT